MRLRSEGVAGKTLHSRGRAQKDRRQTRPVWNDPAVPASIQVDRFGAASAARDRLAWQRTRDFVRMIKQTGATRVETVIVTVGRIIDLMRNGMPRIRYGLVALLAMATAISVGQTAVSKPLDPSDVSAKSAIILDAASG